MTLTEAIARANELLPGYPAPEGTNDPRWQAIIEVAEYIPSDPDGVCRFVRQWGNHPQEDLRSAIATCVLEHLLEHHFDHVFPSVADWARADAGFADTVQRCWLFGQARIPANAARFHALVEDVARPAV